MKVLFVLITILFSGFVYAQDLAYLCGDPPPVDNTQLKSDIEGKANLLKRFVGNVALKGSIESSRKEIFSKYPSADKLVVDHYITYQTCVLLMNDTSLNTRQKLEELRKMRTEFQTVSDNQRIVKTCRHPDFGLQEWGATEEITQSSGWVGGGSNKTNWCNQLIGQIIHRRKIDSNHKAAIIRKSEEGRWTGLLGRDRQYNYQCTIRMQWSPIYNERQDASRCGVIE